MSHSPCGDGVFRYQGRLCVTNVDDLIKRILDKAHGYHYSIHPGSKKMYHELRKLFLWDSLKRDIMEFIAKSKLPTSDS